MGFAFKLEFLKKHRKRLEEAAQREYMEARQNLDRCLAVIAGHFQAIDDTRVEIARLQREGSSAALAGILEGERFIQGEKIRIIKEKERAREFMQIMEEKHERLVEAARSYKMLEKLRDRKYAEFRKQAKRQDAKRLDDIVTMRSKRGIVT